MGQYAKQFPSALTKTIKIALQNLLRFAIFRTCSIAPVHRTDDRLVIHYQLKRNAYGIFGYFYKAASHQRSASMYILLP
jgi:hypothetical protein